MIYNKEPAAEPREKAAWAPTAPTAFVRTKRHTLIRSYIHTYIHTNSPHTYIHTYKEYYLEASSEASLTGESSHILFTA